MSSNTPGKPYRKVDEAGTDTEGHLMRGREVEDADTEGHPFKRITEGAGDEQDTEGHGRRLPRDDDDTEGHASPGRG
jgi:hypothetical protein